MSANAVNEEKKRITIVGLEYNIIKKCEIYIYTSSYYMHELNCIYYNMDRVKRGTTTQPTNCLLNALTFHNMDYNPLHGE